MIKLIQLSILAALCATSTLAREVPMTEQQAENYLQRQGQIMGRRRLNIFDKVVGWVGDQLKKPRTQAAKRDQAAMEDPDSTRTIEEMIQARGFGFESH